MTGTGGNTNRTEAAQNLEAARARISGAATRAEAAPAAKDASPIPAAALTPGTPAAPVRGTLSERARGHYRTLSKARRDGDWARFGAELKALGRVIEEMNRAAR